MDRLSSGISTGRGWMLGLSLCGSVLLAGCRGGGSSTTTTPQVTATPVISPAGGTFTAAQQVTITDSTSGSTIYYTTNGSTPSTSSTKYTAAISVGATETIEAMAVATGYNTSVTASDTFTINIATLTWVP